jgi:pyrimidine operon attenuation protein/uracil phosphoribosyltransferase
MEAAYFCCHMSEKTIKVVLSGKRFQIMIDRLCQELIENYELFEDTCLIGIQAKGVYLANRIYHRLTTKFGIPSMEYGKLDITFYRDDFRTTNKPLKPNTTEINFLVEAKKVILVDDVTYTGRTIQAALTGLNYYGRPSKVELLTLVDRRFNRHVPITTDYIGMTVDTVDAYVKVEWEEITGTDQVLLYS